MRSDARDNRAKIIAAAIDIIEQQGTMASLNEIAKQAGIGPGTLYRHFPTRDELLAEVPVASTRATHGYRVGERPGRLA